MSGYRAPQPPFSVRPDIRRTLLDTNRPNAEQVTCLVTISTYIATKTCLQVMPLDRIMYPQYILHFILYIRSVVWHRSSSQPASAENVLDGCMHIPTSGKKCTHVL